MDHLTGIDDDTVTQQPPALRVSRTFAARPQTVFAAWSTAEHVKQWFSPQTYSVPAAKVEMQVGGAFDVCMRSPDGVEHWTRGTLVEVSPPTRLVIEMRVADSDGEPLFGAHTDVTFGEVSGGTRMDVVQTYTFVDPTIAAPMVAGAPEGWRTTLDKLDAEITAMEG